MSSPGAEPGGLEVTRERTVQLAGVLCGAMGMDLRLQLRELRQRADADAVAPPDVREAGRHSINLAELGLRVTLTRSRYPNTPGGVEQYAVTISRLALDHAPAAPEVAAVLDAAFGKAAARAVERPGGQVVRMFRIPCSAV